MVVRRAGEARGAKGVGEARAVRGKTEEHVEFGAKKDRTIRGTEYRLDT